ncbi:ABC transporter ATP-binding protein [Massilia arenosa]|uniref:ABC transporter ATP-binding protein n=1 Tax=Zemynaea arenosa TaxID=2561931 RepID=A0A4Y9SED9_9BURK|nr:ABC transporter ATP-binding protein [Massilia arenosa]TFW21425.1 ABC transporter ATP-binding protein [Massilia arenosa]
MNRAEPLMALAAITKSFTLGSATIHALRGVDMSIRRGETVAVTGPSGSGKSTLLNLCGLLDQPDGGEVWFDGAALRNASETSRAQLRRAAIGFVFQSFNLVPVMSAADNVDYPLYLLGVPPRERAERVARALDRVGLSGFAKHRPDQLSGGQRQRVAIARAIVKNPRLVIADEPTANLDAATAAQVISLMKQLAHEQGTSFVIATHDDRMLAHCDRALMLDDGVLAGGSYAN